MTDSSREIVAAGQKLYDETLKAQVESLYRGKLLALDVATGKSLLRTCVLCSDQPCEHENSEDGEV